MFLYFGAMQMTVLARPWLAFDLSADESGQRSALVLGLTVAANTAPSLVLSPWAGALADRMSKRTMLMVAGALMAAFALATAAGLAMDAFSWWHVTILGVFQGVVMTFITPSRRAIISELVDREHLLNAVALHTVQQNLNRTMMPALAGFVIALAGAEWAYVVIAAFYVIAVTALFTVPVPRAGAERAVAAHDVRRRRRRVPLRRAGPGHPHVVAHRPRGGRLRPAHPTPAAVVPRRTGHRSGALGHPLHVLWDRLVDGLPRLRRRWGTSAARGSY